MKWIETTDKNNPLSCRGEYCFNINWLEHSTNGNVAYYSVRKDISGLWESTFWHGNRGHSVGKLYKTEIDAKAVCLEHLKRMYAEFFVQISEILGDNTKNIKGRKNNKMIVTIDPGAKGAICVEQDGFVYVKNLSSSMTENAEALKEIFPPEQTQITCIVEDVGYHREGNHAQSSAKFARHCGELDAILYMLEVPFQKITPRMWEELYPQRPKDKMERKRYFRDYAQRRFKHIRATLQNGDALCMMDLALNKKIEV